MLSAVNPGCDLCDGTGFASTVEDGRESFGPCACRGRAVSPAEQLASVGVPARNCGLTREGLSQTQRRVLSRAAEHVGQSESVVLTGDPGCGKTGVAIVLALDALERGQTVRWCHVPDWLRLLRDTFGREDGPTEAAMLAEFVGADLALVDDLGAEHLTDWTRAMVYGLVDARDAEARATIYTTNLPLTGAQSIASTYDGRVASRLGRCKLLAFAPGSPDLRAGKARG